MGSLDAFPDKVTGRVDLPVSGVAPGQAVDGKTAGSYRGCVIDRYRCCEFLHFKLDLNIRQCPFIDPAQSVAVQNNQRIEAVCGLL